jgi:hypothetical protein
MTLISKVAQELFESDDGADALYQDEAGDYYVRVGGTPKNLSSGGSQPFGTTWVQVVINSGAAVLNVDSPTYDSTPDQYSIHSQSADNNFSHTVDGIVTAKAGWFVMAGQIGPQGIAPVLDGGSTLLRWLWLYAGLGTNDVFNGNGNDCAIPIGQLASIKQSIGGTPGQCAAHDPVISYLGFLFACTGTDSLTSPEGALGSVGDGARVLIYQVA